MTPSQAKDFEPKKVLLTGANGFIGQKLLERLIEIKTIDAIAVARNRNDLRKSDQFSAFEVPDYLAANWNQLLQSVDCVIHVAGIIQPPKNSQSPEEDMLRVNGEVTERLIQASIAQDVRQFIYLSSLSVYGQKNDNRHLSPSSPPTPDSMYARSKFAGETAIEKATANSSINWVMVRPPMVIGAGTQGAFYSMANLCAKTGFSPFGAIKNPYPIVFNSTLIDFIIAAVQLSPIENGVYLVGENRHYSVPEILDQIAALSEATVRHLPVPKPLLKILMHVLGKRKPYDQVTGGLTLDVSKAHQVLEDFKR